MSALLIYTCLLRNKEHPLFSLKLCAKSVGEYTKNPTYRDLKCY